MRWPLPWPKSWREAAPPEGGPPEEGDDEGEEKPKSLREQVILFARDIAIAFLVVAIVMGALFTYTRVWPPMVVVESDSMQHSGKTSSIGVIDTGDLVLVQTVSLASDIITYEEGRSQGYETYSNYGDVIIFHSPSSPPDATPIIHRAMVYVVPNPGGGVDVPSLVDHPSDWSGTWANGAQATEPVNLTELTLHNVRTWFGNEPSLQDVTWRVGGFKGAGFLTKGDHNYNGDEGWGAAIGVNLIVGKARGELPWFGLIKLTLAPGTSGCCPRGWGDPSAPKNSWDSLLVSLIVIVVGPFAADFGWSFYRDWKKARRKAAKAASAANPGGDGIPPPQEPPPPLEAATPEIPPEPAQPSAPEDGPTDEPRTTSSGPGGDGPSGP